MISVGSSTISSMISVDSSTISSMISVGSSTIDFEDERTRTLISLSLSSFREFSVN